MQNKFTFHILGGDSRFRAAQSRLIFECGFHAELYADLLEIWAAPPRGGVILAGKDGIDTIEQALADAEIWVPIVVASKSPSVREVVETIRAGAFDYLELPLDSSQVKRVVHATHSEGAYVIEARRRKFAAEERIGRVSSRELEVLDCVSKGLRNESIARALNISRRTVEVHRANMLEKLKASSISEALQLRLEADWAIPATYSRKNRSKIVRSSKKLK